MTKTTLLINRTGILHFVVRIERFQFNELIRLIILIDTTGLLLFENLNIRELLHKIPLNFVIPIKFVLFQIIEAVVLPPHNAKFSSLMKLGPLLHSVVDQDVLHLKSVSINMQLASMFIRKSRK